MRRLRTIIAALLLVTTVVTTGASVSAATEQSGLTAWVARPGTSWSQTVSVAPGEVVNVFITYTNHNNSVGQKYVMLHDTLPTGATFNAGSAYLYTPSAPAGVQQSDTLTTTGISTGNLKAGESASIQYQMTLPAAGSFSCGTNHVTNRVDGTSRSGNETYATANRIKVVRDCPATPPATTTTPATTTPAVQNVNNTYVNTTVLAAADAEVPAPSAPQVQTAAATASSPAAAMTTADDTDAKTLVNTGPGSVLLLVIGAVIVGAVGSRFALYRLVGA